MYIFVWSQSVNYKMVDSDSIDSDEGLMYNTSEEAFHHYSVEFTVSINDTWLKMVVKLALHI